MADRRRHGRALARLTTLLVVLALVAAACGGGGSSKGTSSAPKKEGTPTPGGSITYGLEAETTTFCLNLAQLAAGGIEEVQAVYDTLTVPNDKGQYVPYLAKSITPSPDSKTWTITLRDGVRFHDGTALDATALKQNLDAYRAGTLFQFVFSNIQDVAIADPMSVKVTMKVAWPAFPAFLFSTGRMGIMAPAQINDKDGCPRHLIGTGPFMLKDYVVNDHMTVVKNPNYWRKGLPYLDQIVFKPIPEASQRVNALKAGQLDILQTNSGRQIFDLRTSVQAGQLAMVENQNAAEVSYDMFNVTKPPFDDIRARQAVAYARDVNEENQLLNRGVQTLAEVPFAPDQVGYVRDPGFPRHDLNKAKQLAADYAQAHGGQPLKFTVLLGPDPESLQEAQLFASQMQKAGIQVTTNQADQAQQINLVLAGNYQITQFRNHPGGDPDLQYIWWHSGLPTNFNNGGISGLGKTFDSKIDSDLDAGRINPDPTARKALYEDISRRFASQVYNLWKWYALWAFPSKKTVHGIGGPDLPDGGKQGLVASVHPLVGLWVSK